jgi:hypothetical protein
MHCINIPRKAARAAGEKIGASSFDFGDGARHALPAMPEGEEGDEESDSEDDDSEDDAHHLVRKPRPQLGEVRVFVYSSDEYFYAG